MIGRTFSFAVSLVVLGGMALTTLSSLAADEIKWSLDVKQLQVHDTPFKGRMTGCSDFVLDPKTVTLNGHSLVIGGKGAGQNTSGSVTITDRRLEMGPSLEGLKLVIEPAAQPRKGVAPESTVQVSWGDYASARSGNDIFRDSFALLLEFSRFQEGRLFARMHLCLPDENRTVFAGRVEIGNVRLAMIRGSLAFPPAINEKYLCLAAVGPTEKDPLDAGQANIELAEGGRLKYSSISVGGHSASYALNASLTQQRGGRFELRNGKPGWHLILLGAGELAPPPAPTKEVSADRFPIMHWPKVQPVPRLYDMKWIYIKDERSVVDCPIELDLARLGSVKLLASGVRDGTVVSVLPVAADGNVPEPKAHGVCPHLTFRTQNGSIGNLQLVEGSYEFMCLTTQQIVQVKRGTTQTVRFNIP